jgi:hypothetical protein
MLDDGGPVTDAELARLLDAGIEGRNRSIALAGRIDVVLDELFDEQEPFASAPLATVGRAARAHAQNDHPMRDRDHSPRREDLASSSRSPAVRGSVRSMPLLDVSEMVDTTLRAGMSGRGG